MRHTMVTQTFMDLVDLDMYMRCVYTFPYHSLYLSLSYLSQKDFIISHVFYNCMTDFPHHHSIMYDLTPLYSPVHFTFSCHL